jgi:DNA-binding Lrp family transcriptional regulator
MPRKYLSAKKFKVAPLAVFQETQKVDVDKLDKKILRTLSTHGGLPHRQLALKLAMPLSTLELRLKKLEEKKVILGYTFAIDSNLVSIQQFKFLIFGKGIDSALGRKLFQFANQHPNVTVFLQTLGAWDYELNVEVERSEDIVQVRQELYEFVGSDLLSVKVLPKFRDLKFLTHPSEGAEGSTFALRMPQGIQYS